MRNYEKIVELLDNVVAEFKEVIQETHAMASLDQTLDSYSLNKLMKANARAEAAIALKRLVDITSEDEYATVVQFVQSNAKDALRTSGNTHFSVVSFYNEALKALGASV